MIDVCVQEENIVCEGVGTVHGVRHPLGVSEDTALADKRG